MSKLKDTLLMMAVEKETFEVNGKTFQIIEVKEAEQPKVKPHPNALTFDELEDGKSYLLAKKDGYMSPTNKRFVSCGFYYLSDECFDFFLDETTDGDCFSHRVGSEDFRNEYFTKYVHKAEQPQPDYSHLVGKWVRVPNRCHRYWDERIKEGGWLQIEELREYGGFWFFDKSFYLSEQYLDLTNPQETNPDEVKKILVPSEIGIGKIGSIMCIFFGDSQALFVGKTETSYCVGSDKCLEPIQCELIKCERAELKKGDLAFRSDSEERLELKDLFRYCVIIDESRHCLVGDSASIIVRSTEWKLWYKLQPIV